MTTDRKNFIFTPRRGIMAEIEYPGIAKLVSRLVWDQETVRSSRTTRTKSPLKSMISEGFFLFLIRKGKKSKILILAGQQRVYLTDDQIIRTILSMEDNETEWFLAQFISLYVGNGVQTTLELDKTKFTYTGLPSFPEERDILLFSDTNIKLSHFCCRITIVTGFSQNRTQYLNHKSAVIIS